MKNIIKYLLILVAGALVLSSCEDLESNYAAMTKDYDPNNTTYYIQFLNASASYATDIDADGQPTNIVTTVGVALLGAPQSSAITVNLSADPSSTVTSAMYNLSSSSITIPAGGTAGSVDITFLASEMPEDETLNLVLNMDAGGAEASSANVLDYEVLRIKFCPLDDPNDLVGTWGGVDDWGNSESMTTAYDGTDFTMIDLGTTWLADIWGESILAMNPVVVTMNPNGTLVIEEQDYCTTDYLGSPYDYTIMGEGTWDNCKKTMYIEYDMFNTTDGYALSDYGYAPILVDLELK